MNRTTLARRYAPLAFLAAIQLLIIATVPSTASRQSSTQLSSGTGGSGSSTGVGGTPGGGGPTATTPGGQPINPGGATTGGGGVSGGESGTGGSLGTVPPGVTGGDTTHCSGGREFSPTIAYWAPPCVPGTPGATNVDNGGATSPGVSANQITIVDYNSDSGAEVDAILQAQGQYISYAQAQVVDRAYQNFINKEYVLYGRRVNIVTYQGQCQSVPPDTNCLIPEMDKIVAQYHPFGFYWRNTLCSACYAELARSKVVTFGSQGFSDEFATANAPYVWSSVETATRIQKAFAEFYCKQLNAKPTKFVGTGNPAQNFNGRPRQLGIISTNDPDNENTVKNVLVPALKACGADVKGHFYFYAQDINTAAQQTGAGIAAMDTPNNPATTVLCLCDSVAPQFLLEGEKLNNYFPENVIASDQGMDLDRAAQSYEGGISCVGGHPCEFDVAFGLSPNGPLQPSTNDEGTRMYALGGGSNLPIDGLANYQTAEDYAMIAALLENAGPNLTPQTMAARAPALGSVGGGTTGQALLQLSPGDYGWQQDARAVYWSPNVKSSFNGQPGTFISMEGNRFNLGQYPTLAQPPIPSPRP